MRVQHTPTHTCVQHTPQAHMDTNNQMQLITLQLRDGNWVALNRSLASIGTRFGSGFESLTGWG